MPVFGMLRGIVASLRVIPTGFLIPDGATPPVAGLPATVGVLPTAAPAGGTVGLTIGTPAPTRHRRIFAEALTPLMFTGCTRFPRHGPADVRWFQVLCAVDPPTHVGEGIRALLLPPGGPGAIPLRVCLSVPPAAIPVFGAIGVKGFHRRTQD